VNPSVGLSEIARLGARVERGQPLAVIHVARPKDADQAEAALRAAITLSDSPVQGPDLISDRIG